MRTATKEYDHSLFRSGVLDVTSVKHTMNDVSAEYVPYVTPVYDRLPLTARMDLLLPEDHMGNLTPLTDRQEYVGNNRLMQLDLATYSPIGSFKFRGAWNAIASVDYHQLLEHGVVTASVGNHAQGVAMGVRRLNELFDAHSFSGRNGRRVHADIYVPSSVAPVKLEGIKNIGGDDVSIVVHGNTYDEAYEAACQRTDNLKGATLIHPYDNDLTVSGQSMVGYAVARELQKQQINPSEVILVVPVGGGGLLAGIMKALRTIYPDANARPEVVLAQLEGADSAVQSWQYFKKHNQLKAVPVAGDVNAFADGAAVRTIGAHGLQALPYVSNTVLVTNSQLANGYKRHLDSIYMNLMEVYANHSVDPFFGLQEPASMIADVAAYQYAQRQHGKTVIHLKTGINVNQELVEQLLG